MGLDFVDDVAGQFEVRQAFDNALHLPVSSTSLVFSSNEEVQVGLLVLDEVVALLASEKGPSFGRRFGYQVVEVRA